MADFELHGYLTTGKFQVNDYTIEIERVDDGMRMRVTDGKGEVQEAIVKDGKPEMSAEEIAELRKIYERMTEAYPEWQSKEFERQKAERERLAAEVGRADLYALMKALYDRLYPKIDEDLAATQAAKAAAEAARDLADQIVNVDFENAFFYHPGDTITIGDSGTAQGTSLNANGYVTGGDNGREYIHLKIPMAKRLDKISAVSCQSFIVNIANSGGFGMASSPQPGGHNYTGNVASINIDTVQNCLHVVLFKTGGFTLKANETVYCGIGSNRDGVPAVVFTLG